MLTGDQRPTAGAVGRHLGLTPAAIRSRVSPGDKLELVRGPSLATLGRPRPRVREGIPPTGGCLDDNLLNAQRFYLAFGMHSKERR